MAAWTRKHGQTPRLKRAKPRPGSPGVSVNLAALYVLWTEDGQDVQTEDGSNILTS